MREELHNAILLMAEVIYRDPNQKKLKRMLVKVRTDLRRAADEARRLGFTEEADYYHRVSETLDIRQKPSTVVLAEDRFERGTS